MPLHKKGLKGTHGTGRGRTDCWNSRPPEGFVHQSGVVDSFAVAGRRLQSLPDGMTHMKME